MELIENQGTEEKQQYAEMQDGEIVPVYEYHYTGSKPMQVGGDGPIPGSTWSTAHDNPLLPGYISLGPGPIYGEVVPEK